MMEHWLKILEAMLVAVMSSVMAFLVIYFTSVSEVLFCVVSDM